MSFRKTNKVPITTRETQAETSTLCILVKQTRNVSRTSTTFQTSPQNQGKSNQELTLFSRRNFVINFKQTLPRDDKMVVNLTPSNFNGNFEFLMPKLSKSLIPFQKVPDRKPINNVNKAVTNDSTVYDNIDRFYQSNSKFKK